MPPPTTRYALAASVPDTHVLDVADPNHVHYLAHCRIGILLQALRRLPEAVFVHEMLLHREHVNEDWVLLHVGDVLAQVGPFDHFGVQAELTAHLP